MKPYMPNPFAKTNCDKCVFAKYYSKTTWGCLIGGFRDRGSSCNIMTDDMYYKKDGTPVIGRAFIDKTRCTKKQIAAVLAAVGELRK